jgi:hypothetical protein
MLYLVEEEIVDLEGIVNLEGIVDLEGIRGSENNTFENLEILLL